MDGRGADPAPFDEHDVLVKIYGRNEAPCAKLNGWTHYFPVDFPNLHNIKRVKTVCPLVLERGPAAGDDAKMRRMKKDYKNRHPLSELVAHGPHGQFGVKIYTPVVVTVVAKKQLELVALKNGMALLFGQILVADESGVCILKLVNTAIEIVYNQVELGDRLLIAYATMVDPSQFDYYSGFGSQKYFLPMVLKVGEFQCYQVHKLKTDTELCAVPGYITNGRRLWSPSALEAEPLRLRTIQTFITGDIIGVISHVSRLERQRRYTSSVTLDDGTEDDNFIQFDVRCWIEIIDGESKAPVPIMVTLSSLLWSKQSDLVSGSVVIITNVEFPDWNFHYEYLQTTAFSEIYINNKIFDYLLLMDKRPAFLNEAKKLIGLDEGLKVLRRTDVTWSMGGAYVLPVKDELKFTETYYNKKMKLMSAGPEWPTFPTIPLHRRESELLVFKGLILRYNLFRKDWDNEFSCWTWISESAFETNRITNRSINKIYDPIPVHTKNTCLWYLFTRRLPKVDLDELLLHTTRSENKKRKAKIYEDVSAFHKKYNAPLCMPSVPGAKKLKELEAIDGATHYAVDLWNPQGPTDLRRHIMTWKPSRNQTLAQIKDKLEALQDENVMAIVKVHRLESLGLRNNFGYEFMIHDIVPFVSEEDFWRSKESQSQD